MFILMQISDLIIIFLMITSITLFTMSYLKTCPVQKQPIVVYKNYPELDLQFSENNLPSHLYNNVFNEPNPWIGGYKLESRMSDKPIPPKS
jgi:hypothetical protein